MTDIPPWLKRARRNIARVLRAPKVQAMLQAQRKAVERARKKRR